MGRRIAIAQIQWQMEIDVPQMKTLYMWTSWVILSTVQQDNVAFFEIRVTSLSWLYHSVFLIEAFQVFGWKKGGVDSYFLRIKWNCVFKLGTGITLFHIATHNFRITLKSQWKASDV